MWKYILFLFSYQNFMANLWSRSPEKTYNLGNSAIAAGHVWTKKRDFVPILARKSHICQLWASAWTSALLSFCQEHVRTSLLWHFLSAPETPHFSLNILFSLSCVHALKNIVNVHVPAMTSQGWGRQSTQNCHIACRLQQIVISLLPRVGPLLYLSWQ